VDEFIYCETGRDPDIMNQQEEDPDVYYISKGKAICMYPTGSMSSSTSAYRCSGCVRKKRSGALLQQRGAGDAEKA